MRLTQRGKGKILWMPGDSPLRTVDLTSWVMDFDLSAWTEDWAMLGDGLRMGGGGFVRLSTIAPWNLEDQGLVLYWPEGLTGRLEMWPVAVVSRDARNTYRFALIDEPVLQ